MTDLKQWRSDLGLTQPQMARYVGVSIHTWRKWEQGQHGWPEAAQSLIDLLQELEGEDISCSGFISDRVYQAWKGE